jgi:hypothetical protein
MYPCIIEWMGGQTWYVCVVSLGSSANNNTPSQHRVLGVVADHGVSLADEIKRAGSFVMRRGVVLCKVVTQVFVSGGPANVLCSLLDAVLDPVVAHVHSLGPFLENGFVCNAISGGIVGFELCSILWVAHLFVCFAGDGASYGIDRQGAIMGFSDRRDNVFEDGGLANQGYIRERRALGVLAVTEEEITANTRLCAWFGEVRCIAVYFQLHVGCVVATGGIRLGDAII